MQPLGCPAAPTFPLPPPTPPRRALCYSPSLQLPNLPAHCAPRPLHVLFTPPGTPSLHFSTYFQIPLDARPVHPQTGEAPLLCLPTMAAPKILCRMTSSPFLFCCPSWVPGIQGARHPFIHSVSPLFIKGVYQRTNQINELSVCRKTPTLRCLLGVESKN